jgi:hypothetical protein
MAKFGFTEYLKTYRLSVMRWLVVGTIIATVFLADHYLGKNVSTKLSEAWYEACATGTSAAACLGRVDSHHDDCFESSYSSMLMTFGQSRWDALKIEAYENCMAGEKAVESSDQQKGQFTISGEVER